MTDFKIIKLKDYATLNGVQYRTAWNRFKAGKIQNAYQDEFGNIFIKMLNNPNHDKYDLKKIAIYGRVSNHSAKNNLTRQIERLTDYSIRNGYTIVKSVLEIASGMNDTRPLLHKLLKDDSWGTLIVENKDRLTRFGFNYIKILLENDGRQIIVVNESKDDTSDIVQDLISIIYSFSAKLYGKRNNKNKVQSIVNEVQLLNQSLNEIIK